MTVWIGSFVTCVVLYQVVSILALWFRRNDYADVLWGPVFPLSILGGILLGLPEGFSSLDTRTIILFGLVSIWAVRLFFHIGYRTLLKKDEDIRYKKWRIEWGAPALLRSWLQVFVLQGFIAYFFMIGILYSVSHAGYPMGVISYLGIVIWLIGFVFEAVSDEQLRRFKADSKNKGLIMDKGLWSWSRHPNYFGEITQWWGLWICVSEIPDSLWTIVATLGTTFIIMKVSGVDMLEKLMSQRPGYAEYAKKTSKFFPRPPL